MTGAAPANGGDIPTLAFTIEYDLISRKLLSDAQVILNGKEAKTAALWDTGASRTCISSEVAEALNLVPTGKMQIRTPSGTGTVNTYLVDLGLPNKVKVESVPVCDSRIGEQGIGVLIGMDIISLGDFAVSNHGGKTCFSFRMPSSAKVDFVREIRVQNAIGPKHGPGKRKRKKK